MSITEASIKFPPKGDLESGCYTAKVCRANIGNIIEFVCDTVNPL